MKGRSSTNNNEREAFRWYRQGRRDGETAARNASAGDHEVACFLYQQGAEKLLKAVLVPTRYPNGVPDGAPYEFFSAGHSRRGEASYRKVAEVVAPLFSHLGG